jgi:hypothetical protein
MESTQLLANIQRALVEKWRFETKRGSLSLEEVYALPLKGNNGVNLDEVAKAIYAQIPKDDAVISFVDDVKSTHATIAEAQLEIVKDRISQLQSAARAHQEEVARAQEVAVYRNLLAKKQQEALENLTADELRARLAELQG